MNELNRFIWQGFNLAILNFANLKSYKKRIANFAKFSPCQNFSE